MVKHKCFFKTLYKRFSLILLCLVLTACGFHLRGHVPLPPQLRFLFLQCVDPFSPLSKQLAQALCSSGIHLAPNSKAAPVTLQILTDNFGQSMSNIGTGGQLTTYNLVYNVCFQLVDANGRIILPPQTVTTTRVYSVASNLILANTSALTCLEEDMRRDLIFQILYRLRAPCTVRALNSTVCY